MTEEQLQAIDSLLEQLPGKGVWWVQQIRTGGWLREVMYKTEEGYRSAIATKLDKQDANYIAKSPTIIRQLLAEVRFLRGQLGDLCEDSRAVAEVMRLREALEKVTTERDQARKAIANVPPKYKFEFVNDVD